MPEPTLEELRAPFLGQVLLGIDESDPEWTILSFSSDFQIHVGCGGIVFVHGDKNKLV